MANSDKNILITPSVGLSTNPTIKFNGANNTPTTLRVLDDGTVSFEGTAGQLFSISDGLTGSIFSVNDISGIPSIEVLDTGLVKLNQYGGSTVFGSSAAIQNSSLVNAKVSISTASASTPGLIIKAVSSQTANLQEWQDSAASVLASVSAGGNISTNRYLFNQASNAPYIDIYGSALTVISRVASYVGLIVKGVASQTADLQQWQNSAGTVLAKIAADGAVSLASGGVDIHGAGANFTIRNAGTTAWYLNSSLLVGTGYSAGIGVIIRGNGSQTADLQQWQDSAGTVLARVYNNGVLSAGSLYAATGDLAVAFGGYFGGGTAGGYIGAAVSVIPWTTAVVGVIVRGRASQTANLQEWQNSAGTVLGKIDAGGVVTFGIQSVINANLSVAGTNHSFLSGTSGVLQVNFTNNSTLGSSSLYLGTTSTTNASDRRFSFQVGGGNLGGQLGASIFEGNLLIKEVVNSTSNETVRLTILRGGEVLFGTAASTGTLGSTAGLQTLSASTVGLIVKGTTSQTANLQEWQSSTGTVLASIGPGGWASFVGGGVNITGGSALLVNNNIYSVYGAIVAGGLPDPAPAQLTSLSRAATTIGLVVRGYASQTANLQEWQNNSGTVLASINSVGKVTAPSAALASTEFYSNGNVAFGGTLTQFNSVSVGSGNSISARLQIKPYAADNIGVIVQGFTSQTANLQEWQNSAGTVMSFVGPTGNFKFPYFQADSWYDRNDTTPYLTMSSNKLIANSRNASYVGFIVQGSASQTADLQQWQNSAGTVLAKVDASGNFILNGVTMSQSASSVTATNLGTTNNRVYLKEENSGGQVRITKSTAAAANNRATDLAQLYLRDGTTAGTLKLVIIAGTTGAETTILDNIPQS